MDVSEKEIVVEFERQVRLCSGIGRAAQERIVEGFWSNKPEPEHPELEAIAAMLRRKGEKEGR